MTILAFILCVVIAHCMGIGWALIIATATISVISPVLAWGFIGAIVLFKEIL